MSEPRYSVQKTYRAWTADDDAQLKHLWAAHSSTEIARIVGRGRGSILGRSRRLNLHYKASRGGLVIKDTHPAAQDGRTVFPSTVRTDFRSGVLKSGDNARKLGAIVAKGKWRGFPIFALTLEERATCPRSCVQWTTCYGNNMPFSVRHKSGPELEDAIERDLAYLNRQSPFVVRLHILGDFYSVEYVECWENWFSRFPGLHAFGYTAHAPDSEIGRSVKILNGVYSDRCSIRFSGVNAIVIDAEADRGESIVCPAQTEKTKSCATCALCWASEKSIAFLRH